VRNPAVVWQDRETCRVGTVPPGDPEPLAGDALMCL